MPFDEILPSDHLGDRMLHLKPCIHLEEKKGIVFHQKLDGARADVTDDSRSLYRRFAHRSTQLYRQPRRRSFLQYFLVMTLH